MLKVDHISFAYDSKKPVLQNLSFHMDTGSHLCVMGESGCGKSTLLKAIYGLLDLNAGSLYWKDQQILGPAYHLIPGMDFIKYVAQDFDLMPFTSVFDNVSKFLSRIYVNETKKRTERLLEVVGLTPFAEETVKNLSGGQQQRVAIARALAKEPELLLLDEPFGQIDNFKKNNLRRTLFTYLKERNISCIVATHDGLDALSFADQMIVLQNNRIIADDRPEKIYHRPASKYIASHFDEVNEIELNGEPELLYPHQLKIVEYSKRKAKVKNNYFKGHSWLIEVEFNGQTILVNHSGKIKKGNSIFFEIK